MADDTEVIDSGKEQLFPLAELGKHLPTPRGRSTLHSWATDGMPHVDGHTYFRLETLLIAGVRHSTVEAYHRLLRKCNSPLQLPKDKRNAQQRTH